MISHASYGHMSMLVSYDIKKRQLDAGCAKHYSLHV